LRYIRPVIVLAVLLAVLVMIPFTLRLTARDRRKPRGLRWQGIDWERVKDDPPPEEPAAPGAPEKEEKAEP
jgi:hypothetical protein